MKQVIVISMLIWAATHCNTLHCQQDYHEYRFDTTETYLLTLKDGFETVCQFIESDSVSANFRTKLISRLEIPLQNIKQVDVLNSRNYIGGEYWFANPNATRYFFAPSAICLKPGEWYYQNTYLVLNSVNVGISKNFSMGGGFELITTFSKESTSPIYLLTPKLGFKAGELLHLGGGVLYASLPSDSQSTNLTVAYGLVTAGNDNNNLTLGLGHLFAKFGNENELNAFADHNTVITCSGMYRIAKKTSLVSENWLIIDEEAHGIYSYGIRFFGEKLTVDLAFINNSDIIEFLFIGIPYVDFLVKF